MTRSFPMLYVSDVQACASFYERGLGATVEHAHDDWTYAEITLGSLTIGLVDAGQAAEHLPIAFRPHARTEPPAGFELYVEVEEVDEAVEQAVGAGATALGPTSDKPWGQRVAYLRDRDGVIIEFASRP